MLFERLLVYDDRSLSDAALNMAIDEALLEDSDEPALRFYGWERPAISFGYFGEFVEAAEGNGNRELVRRWTGGGIVPHGDDLTYSLVTPATHPVFARGPATIYAVLHAAIRDALHAENIAAELATDSAPKISEACFANPVRDDVLSRGSKVAGAAQRRTRRGFLHQGSIQIPNLRQTFRDRFSRALASQVQERPLPPSLLARAKVLAAEKYGSEAWLKRR